MAAILFRPQCVNISIGLTLLGNKQVQFIQVNGQNWISTYTQKVYPNNSFFLFNFPVECPKTIASLPQLCANSYGINEQINYFF